MSTNVIPFPPAEKFAPLGPDDWRWMILGDALLQISNATSIDEARRIAVEALGEACGGDAA